MSFIHLYDGFQNNVISKEEEYSELNLPVSWQHNMPIPYPFDGISAILSSTSDTTFMTLMERVPLRIVSERYISRFDEYYPSFSNDSLLVMWNLPKILTLLKEMLRIFEGKLSSSQLPGTINKKCENNRENR